MDKTISSSNTKAQILKAYDEVLKKLEEKSEDKPKEVQQKKDDIKIVTSAQKNTEGSIFKSISALKLSFNESLEKIQEDLVNEYNKLIEIQEAIKIEKKNLEDLYGISTNTDSLAAMLLAQKEGREKFDLEMKSAKDNHEMEMDKTKSLWDKQKAEHEASIKEESVSIQKTRKREEEEYDYNLLQKRKKETDAYEVKKATQETELKEKKATFEREFAEREKAILEKEKEYKVLKQASDNFPKELEKAVQQAKSELEASLKSEFKYEKDLKAKESEGLISLKDLQITTLENKIKEMEVQIKVLGQKSETSEKSVKDIAIKAIESSHKVQFVEKEKGE